VRVLGLASSEAEYRSRLTGVGGVKDYMFDQLARRITLAGVYQPEPTLGSRVWSTMATWSPVEDTRRRSYKRHPVLFKSKSRQCRLEIDRRNGLIDLILQWEFFFGPTDRFPSSVPFCVYNDWTTALIQRQYPHWVLPRVRAGVDRVQGRMLRNAAYVFTFTDLARRSVIEDYGVDPRRAVTVWAGANLPALPADVPKEPEPAEPIVLLVGNEYQRKGVDVLMRAMPLVRRKFPACRAIVVGGQGQGQPVPSRADGVELRPNAGKKELDRLYRQATLFALPSRAEAFGHAYVEAMAYWLPCVGSDTGGVPEVIDEGKTGYLVPVGDHAALADRITGLLERPGLRRAMGQAGRRKVEERFTWERVVDRMLPYLHDAAAGSATHETGSR
jgi:glycosyltransferase involved in cell wall biosynthesis